MPRHTSVGGHTTNRVRWSVQLQQACVSLESRIVDHELIRLYQRKALSRHELLRLLTVFYPVVECFPRLLASAIVRTSSREQATVRSWWIQNLRAEERHVHWWLRWMERLSTASSVEIPRTCTPTVELLINHLFELCDAGDDAEIVSGLNYAIEGPTGEWARESVRQHRVQPRWIRLHAVNDDRHVAEALALLDQLISSQSQLKRATSAARRSLRLYRNALDASMDELRGGVR